MKAALIILLLALLWAGMTWTFSGLNLLLGAAVGGLTIALLRASLGSPTLLRKAWLALALLGLFLRELVVSALRVAALVLKPDLKTALRTDVIAYPLSVTSDAEITLLANLITLTPGTLSIDVSDDWSLLHIHVLDAPSRAAVIADIANGFEARVKELFA